MLPLKCETSFVDMVAGLLARKFIRHLLHFSKEKNYYAYVGGLAEILDWSVEFCNHYYGKFSDWKNTEDQSGISEKAIMLEGLILEFGFDRLRKFYIQNAKHTACLVDKYAAIKS